VSYLLSTAAEYKTRSRPVDALLCLALATHHPRREQLSKEAVEKVIHDAYLARMELHHLDKAKYFSADEDMFLYSPCTELPPNEKIAK
jgi:hypothetical protein